MLHIRLNGEPREVPAGTRLGELLEELQLRGRLAVELNGEILPRGEHADYRLREGDRLEIVQAIGGG
ncbi:MAG: sulfur carrier protein ThiS [Gammaproteobacteria bacterium]|nr:MAG: sulfur carrier protein ThiS [Gammaproteobacteria bacterium]